MDYTGQLEYLEGGADGEHWIIWRAVLMQADINRLVQVAIQVAILK